MTLSTSLVAVWYSSDSVSSRLLACSASNSRVFSMAMTAWSANVFSSSISLSENRPGAARVTAISKHQWSAYPHLRPAAVIPHGVDVSQFTFRAQPDDYVCYLGRFTSGKGPCQAIAAARALGLRLLMAGPPNPYFREKVKPLVDGKTVEYAGFVRGAERDRLLGGARALLYPIQYPEAFGLVLVEAMLCGTPVAGMRLGAVSEIVDEGVTGYCADTPEDFLEAIGRSLLLDRRQIRQQAERRFSAQEMARGYARVYEEVVNTSR